MAGDVKNLKLDAAKAERSGFLDQHVRLDRLDIPAKAQLFKEIRLGEHGDTVLMVADLAPVTAFDFRGINDVVDMPMGKKKETDFFACPAQPIRAVLGGIDENRLPAGFDEKAIGVKNAAGEALNFHGRWCASEKESTKRGKPDFTMAPGALRESPH